MVALEPIAGHDRSKAAADFYVSAISSIDIACCSAREIRNFLTAGWRLSSHFMRRTANADDAVQAFWNTLTSTTMSAAKADLMAMEKAIERTQLDYLLVKAVALTAEKQPTGAWQLITERGTKPPRSFYFSAKSDVALYMVQEAVQPTMARRAVTLGSGAE